MAKIRLWKLGDHTCGIMPDKAAVDKLINMLTHVNPNHGDIDVVWDSLLTVQEFDISWPDTYKQVIVKKDKKIKKNKGKKNVSNMSTKK